MKKPNYLEIISKCYPNVWAFDNRLDGAAYENIQLSDDSPDPLPSKETLDVDILDETRIMMWEAIKAERDARIAGGVKVTFDDIDYWFHSDNTSRIQQLALVILGETLPGNIMWKTMGGVFLELDQAKVQAVFQASVNADMAKFQVAEQHKAAMLMSETPETYDFSSGWPDVYGGSQLTV